MTPKAKFEETDLLAMFDDAADIDVPAVPKGLSERILADAHRTNGERRVREMSAQQKPSWLSRALDQIGGIPGSAGLAAAAATGLLIGYTDLTASLGSIEVLGLNFSSFDDGDLFATFDSVTGEL